MSNTQQGETRHGLSERDGATERDRKKKQERLKAKRKKRVQALVGIMEKGGGMEREARP